MEDERSYLNINRHAWNNRLATHLKSEFYDVESFIKGQTSLNSIELELLGDLKGKSILHLQCHFGQDTISLSRLGAETTGIDLSDKAIEFAKKLAKDTKSNADFICCDIYDLPLYLDKEFDIVFTSYGTIGWLPDLDKWAKIIFRFLKPKGEFVFVEFHPIVWMFDENFENLNYRYFKSEAIIETEVGTYADRDAAITQQTITWNHGLGEVINSLIQNGLEIQSLDEFDYSPYNCFNGTVEFEPKKFRIANLENKIPLVYAIVAQKKSE